MFWITNRLFNHYTDQLSNRSPLWFTQQRHIAWEFDIRLQSHSQTAITSFETDECFNRTCKADSQTVSPHDSSPLRTPVAIPHCLVASFCQSVWSWMSSSDFKNCFPSTNVADIWRKSLVRVASSSTSWGQSGILLRAHSTDQIEDRSCASDRIQRFCKVEKRALDRRITVVKRYTPILRLICCPDISFSNSADAFSCTETVFNLVSKVMLLKWMDPEFHIFRPSNTVDDQRSWTDEWSLRNFYEVIRQKLKEFPKSFLSYRSYPPHKRWNIVEQKMTAQASVSCRIRTHMMISS